MKKGNVMARIFTYIFILSLVLILVAYYAGVKTDEQAFASGVRSILQTTTGRGPNNQFAGYPGTNTPQG